MQLPRSQQPLEQFAELQIGVVPQVPELQLCPVAQVAHAEPPVPQLTVRVPGWHWPFESQQPVPQFEAEQLPASRREPGMQALLLQIFPAPQAAQAWAWEPQA